MVECMEYKDVCEHAQCDAFAVFLVSPLGAILPTVSTTYDATHICAFRMFADASSNSVWLSVLSIKMCTSMYDRICFSLCCWLPSQVLFPPTISILHIATCICGPRKPRGCYIDFIYLTIQGGKMRASVHGKTRSSSLLLTLQQFGKCLKPNAYSAAVNTWASTAEPTQPIHTPLNTPDASSPSLRD